MRGHDYPQFPFETTLAWQISVIDEGLLTTKTKNEIQTCRSQPVMRESIAMTGVSACFHRRLDCADSQHPADTHQYSIPKHPFDRPKSAVAAAAAVVEQKMFEATAELQQLEVQIAVLERVMAAVKSADTTGPVIGKIVDDINAAPDLFLKTNESPNPFHAAATGGTASTDGGCCVVV
jgi:hypothetical protein